VRLLIPTVLTALLTVSTMLANAHTEHGKAKHGGSVAEAGVFQAELVVSAGTLTLHITQHGAPLATEGGKAVLIVPGAVKTIAYQLAPSGENRFTVQGSLGNSGVTSVTAVITMPGLPEKRLEFELK
jgi:hypothetical protein